jgi:NADPH2:quinone reductase
VKAVVCHAWGLPSELRVEDLPDPQPGDDEVIIDVEAASVNFPDVLIIQGKYQLRPPLPFTPGAEVAGVVRSVGSAAGQFKPGDLVAGYVSIGGFAEQVCAKAALLTRLPDDVDLVTAAAFNLAYGTSYHALVNRGRLQAGETLLVLGAAGGVGLAAVEIGHALGARVIAAASSDEKLAACRAHGADVLIDYERRPLREAVAEATGKRGVDVVYDPVGGRHAEPAFRSLAWRGRYLCVGFAGGDIPALPWNLALLKEAQLMGVFWGAAIQREPKTYANDQKQLLEWLHIGSLHPQVKVYDSLEHVPQALEDLLSRNVTGKLVVRPRL